MQPDQARYVRDLFIPVVESELETTLRLIAAIPEERKGYRPDPKARSAFELAWHIAGSEIWLMDGILNGAFVPAQDRLPPDLESVADVLEWYDKNFRDRWGKLKALSADRLSRTMPFGVSDYPAIAYLSFLTRHTAHHRGQLSTYLRPMGAKVPSIYGGTADEPWDG